MILWFTVIAVPVSRRTDTDYGCAKGQGNATTPVSGHVTCQVITAVYIHLPARGSMIGMYPVARSPGAEFQ